MNIGDKVRILENFGYDEDGMKLSPEIGEVGKEAIIIRVYSSPITGIYACALKILDGNENTSFPKEYDSISVTDLQKLE